MFNNLASYFILKPNKHSYSAFTLAEILITLAIIGVVASMVIPALQNHIHEEQYKVAWRKSFAEIQTAMNKIQYEEGSYKELRTTPRSVMRALLKELSINRTDNDFAITGTDVYTSLSGDTINTAVYMDEGQILLNNGCTVMFENDGNNRAYIWVDVNGPKKKPNVAGRDLFGMEVLDDRLLPFGAAGTCRYGLMTNPCNSIENTCSTGAGLYSGWGCSQQYLLE